MRSCRWLLGGYCICDFALQPLTFFIVHRQLSIVNRRGYDADYRIYGRSAIPLDRRSTIPDDGRWTIDDGRSLPRISRARPRRFFNRLNRKHADGEVRRVVDAGLSAAT